MCASRHARFIYHQSRRHNLGLIAAAHVNTCAHLIMQDLHILWAEDYAIKYTRCATGIRARNTMCMRMRANISWRDRVMTYRLECCRHSSPRHGVTMDACFHLVMRSHEHTDHEHTHESTQNSKCHQSMSSGLSMHTYACVQLAARSYQLPTCKGTGVDLGPTAPGEVSVPFVHLGGRKGDGGWGGNALPLRLHGIEPAKVKVTL